MNQAGSTTRRSQRGFSMLELMVAMLILTVIAGALFQQIGAVQQRAATEQAKLDMFQQAREFMDQLSRDLHQAGYPGVQVFSSSNTALILNVSNPTSPYATDPIVAVGLTKIAAGDLWFEGDVDGSGQVSVVQYHYDTTGTNCPCLKRSVQTPKNQADPLSQSLPQYQVEVQNVQNGTTGNPIFYAYAHGSGTPLTLPLNFDADATKIASIDTIQIVLTVQSPVPDPKTLLKPITTLVATVKLGNCSAAAPGQGNSCQ